MAGRNRIPGPISCNRNFVRESLLKKQGKRSLTKWDSVDMHPNL